MPDITNQISRARALLGEFRHEEARRVLLDAIRRSPADPDANNLMCFALAHMGENDAAHHYARRAAELAPNSSGAIVNLGNTLAALGKDDEAIETLSRAVTMDDSPAVRNALAMALCGAGRLIQAMEFLRDSMALYPGEPALAADLAWAYHDAGRTDQAAVVLRDALALNPDQPNLAASLAAVMNYIPDASREAVFEAHVAYGRVLERLLPPSAPPALRDPNPERRIRLGIISANFRDHSVGFFASSWLERLDPSRFDLVLYDTSAKADRPPTPRPHTLRRVAWLDEGRLEHAVRSDGLDMLMELSGISLQHRLALMHLKPAPIGLTYIGYPNTTGVRAVDWRIIDAITDPPGAEARATERLARLDPCFLCYTPPTGVSRPETTDGRPFTFASFNHLHKMNEPLLRLWARVLEAVPGSRLLIKATALRDAGVREDLSRRVERAGLDAARVEVMPPTPTREAHLALYAHVDVALDAFPYHGTTTTCEALHMGVPVITRAGASHVSRVGVSLLHAAGLPELVADNDDHYVELARGLATDPARMARIRNTLSHGLAGSVLCDAEAHTRRLELLLRVIFRDACAASTP